MAATQLNRQLHDWFAQRNFRANFENRRRALADTQDGLFEPREVAGSGWLHKTETTCIKLLLLDAQKVDFELYALAQNRSTTQFAETDRRHAP